MYKGIGESAYNDGLFSHAAPYQAYQASVSQFGDGGLGYLTGAAAQARKKADAARSAARRAAVQGMGRTFLPAFSPQEMSGLGYLTGAAAKAAKAADAARAKARRLAQMRGLGYAYNAGVLGDTVTVPGVTTADDATQNSQIHDLNVNYAKGKTYVTQLSAVVGVLAIAVGYLYYKR